MNGVVASRKYLALAAVVTSLMNAGPLNAQTAGSLKLEPYVFEGPANQRVNAELGRLLVPENRKNPRSRLVELVFVRFKSTAPNPGPPIIYLAGGPGASGIGAARGARFPLFMAMREFGDVVALDQRATGMSSPHLLCSQRLGYPLDRVGNREELLRLFAVASRDCEQELRTQGVDLAGYTIVESADDLESLRRALRADRVRLWSISYGTQLALATIRRYETRVERAILAGVEGPEMTLKYPSTIQHHLEAVSGLARRDQNVATKIPDLLSFMAAVYEQLDEAPLKVQVTDSRTQNSARVTLGSVDLKWVTGAAFVGSSALQSLPALYYAVSRRDTASPDVRRWAQWIHAARTSSIGSAMQIMIDCASGASAERLARINREKPTTLLADFVDFPIPDICAAWGRPDLGASFRTPVRSAVPVLLISGTLDGRTPVSNAQEVRKGFPNGADLIIEGAVHGDALFLSSPEIAQVMTDFMRGEEITRRTIALPPMTFSPVSAVSDAP